jgi:hypothetical protein
VAWAEVAGTEFLSPHPADVLAVAGPVSNDAWWNIHMRQRMQEWYSCRVECNWNDTGGLLSFLGMTFDEFADWLNTEKVSDRVKRNWSKSSLPLAYDPGNVIDLTPKEE